MEVFDECDAWLLKLHDEGCRTGRHGAGQRSQVNSAARFRSFVERERDIFRSQRRSVGKTHVAANSNRPGQAIIGEHPGRRQIGLRLQIGISGQQRRLKQRMPVFAPSKNRIIALR